MSIVISGGGGTGGGAGATNLNGLTDVNITSVANGQLLAYNNTSGQWENQTGVTGGLTYKGAFNATAGTPSLANAVQGDFYIIDTAGTIYGQTWNVGDHLLINEDMGGSVTNSKIDKVDNTDQVTSVNGQTGAVTGLLEAANNLSDLVNVPTARANLNLGTAATSAATDFLAVANNLSDVANAATARSNLGAIAEVVEDTTPQLGGNLDVNGQAIVSASAGNIAITPDTTGSIVLDGLNWPQADGTTGQVLQTNGAGQLSFVNQTSGGVTSVNGQTGVVTGLLEAANNLSDVANAATARSNLGAIAEVVEDTTPQLGGPLDVNGQAIVSASAGNIAITPDTTGSIVLDGLNWPQADGTTGQVLQTNGAGQLSFVNQSSGAVTSVNGQTGAVTGLLENVVEDTTPQLGGPLDVNGQAIVSASAGNIAITPDTTGSIVLDGLNWPQADGTTGQVLQTNGAGQLSFVNQSSGAVTSVNGQTGAVTGLLENVVEDTTPQLGGNLDVNGQSIVSASAGNIAITPDTTGSIVLDGLNWPQADGSADQVLKTNGAGQLSFVDQTSGLQDVVDDTSPQLGGDLDVQARIVTTSTANGSIGLEPDGTGSVVARGTGAGNTPGTLTLNCEQNSHGVALQSPPHSAAASYTLKLPTGVGTSGQALTTDGNTPAQLSWTTVGGGGGGSRPTVTTDSSGTNSTISDPAAADLEDIYLVSNGAAAVTITLPTVTANSGYKVNIKRLGTANVTISPASGTIDGAPSQVLSVQYAAYTLTTDGTNWYII